MKNVVIKITFDGKDIALCSEREIEDLVGAVFKVRQSDALFLIKKIKKFICSKCGGKMFKFYNEGKDTLTIKCKACGFSINEKLKSK